MPIYHAYKQRRQSGILMTIKKLHSELSTIVEGMTICDADGKQVGTVDTFYFGEDILGSNGADKETIEEAINNILGDDVLSHDLKTEINESGFLYIECGFLQDNVLILPHQIKDIQEEEILLKITEAELLSF